MEWKDPREYLPYVQSLQQMETLRRKFTIDDDLGRKKKALGHLRDLDDFEALKNYTVKHELYSDAIDFYKYDRSRLEELTRLNADFLNSYNRYREAGLAYEFLNDLSSAIPAYVAANMWREALSCANLLSLPEEEVASLARDLADALIESKDFRNAATIYLDYIGDLETAAQLFCKAYMFSESSRIIALQRKPELLKSILDAGLIECFNTTTDLLADCKGQLGAQVPRLRDLRVKKEQEPRM
jgi:elongator complex protein 1